MKSFCLTILLLACLVLVTPVSFADEQADKLRADFQSVLDDLNDNSMQRFSRAVNKSDMTRRMSSGRLISPEIKQVLDASFQQLVEEMFVEAFPSAEGGEILGTLVDFRTDGNNAEAVVRFGLPNYRFAYHVFELQGASRGRLTIVDWTNYLVGRRFSDRAGEALVSMLPSEPAVRKLLQMPAANQGQVFQTGELLKAYRDDQPERFFKIVDGLDDDIKLNPAVLERRLRLAEKVRDEQRYQSAVLALRQSNADDPLLILTFVDYYMLTKDYQSAYDVLSNFEAALGTPEAATQVRLSALALATGDTGRAETHAASATEIEPDLELGWWSLLRARAAAGNFSTATEALSRLEDGFGHRLDAAKLRRDRFKGFAGLADSEEFGDWRAARD